MFYLVCCDGWTRRQSSNGFKMYLLKIHMIKNVVLWWSLLSHCFIVIIHPLRSVFLFCHLCSRMGQLLRKVTPMCLPSCKNEAWHSWDFKRSLRYTVYFVINCHIRGFNLDSECVFMCPVWMWFVVLITVFPHANQRQISAFCTLKADN